MSEGAIFYFDDPPDVPWWKRLRCWTWGGHAWTRYERDWECARCGSPMPSHMLTTQQMVELARDRASDRQSHAAGHFEHDA